MADDDLPLLPDTGIGRSLLVSDQCRPTVRDGGGGRDPGVDARWRHRLPPTSSGRRAEPDRPTGQCSPAIGQSALTPACHRGENRTSDRCRGPTRHHRGQLDRRDQLATSSSSGAHGSVDRALWTRCARPHHASTTVTIANQLVAEVLRPFERLGRVVNNAGGSPDLDKGPRC